MAVEKTELFSEKVMGGSRTYFFDVKQAKDGAYYLVISESRSKEGGFEHQRVMVFPENVEAFGAALQKAAGFVRSKKGPESGAGKGPSSARARVSN